ncbi:MAG: ABC transporter ATP-binding protein [Thermodesulfobacteriota bacterium]
MLLEVEKLTKSFGGLMAIRNLDLSLEEGEILGLIGPNGSGKSTLFNLITGFLKPDQGLLQFKGQLINGLKPHKVCEVGIARTFQLVRPFNEMTVVKNVMVGRIYGRKPARTLLQAGIESREILKFVGLAGKGEMIAGHLTLSDRKRLELARALATKPALLLLDEIMAGLNPAEAASAIQLVRDIRDSGITVIMVEHIIRAVLDISNKIVVINFGEKIAEGKPEEVVNDPKVIEAYLGSGWNARS